jgi:hypothetical protein
LISGLDDARTISQQRDQTEAGRAAGLPPMTPETARRLAALLAPHLVAMRAVTAGTQYEGSGAGQADAGAAGAGPGLAPRVSPATKIFIAGMLELISA